MPSVTVLHHTDAPLMMSAYYRVDDLVLEFSIVLTE